MIKDYFPLKTFRHSEGNEIPHTSTIKLLIKQNFDNLGSLNTIYPLQFIAINNK